MIAERNILSIGKEAIFEARQVIERYIVSDPLFRDTLEPYDEPKGAHPLIKRMCDAGRAAEVGPMAAVAGAIAEYSVQAMRENGSGPCDRREWRGHRSMLAEETDIGINTLSPRFHGLGLRCRTIVARSSGSALPPA